VQSPPPSPKINTGHLVLCLSLNPTFQKACLDAAYSISNYHSSHLYTTVMPCCGGQREKYGNLNVEQKWEYIVCAWIRVKNPKWLIDSNLNAES
jgi:hypothetical protein